MVMKIMGMETLDLKLFVVMELRQACVIIECLVSNFDCFVFLG